MSQPNAQYACFDVTGSFDPADLTRRAGVAPSKAWRKGEPIEGGYERRFSRWSLHSRLSTASPLEEHIADVLAQLDRNPAAFHAIVQEQEACLQLVGYFHEGFPGLHIEAGLVAGLARYGLGMDCDFYDFRPDSHEDL